MANEVIIERTFDAPVEMIWKYWSEPEYFKKWWGPKDFTCPTANIDFRVGGKYLVAMRGPAGTEYDKDFWSTGTYKEIVHPSDSSGQAKIVTTDSFADENGNIISSEHYGMKGFPTEMLVTINFESQEGKTKMTLVHKAEGISEQDRDNMQQGWNQSFDKLENSLKE